MVDLLERDGYYAAYAIGTDLTAWDNAKAKLAVAELNALDWLYSASFIPTDPLTLKSNPMSSSHYYKRLFNKRHEGLYSSTHYLQTAILTYATMGACSTTEGTPDDHNITKGTTTTPINFAIHFEKEGTTSAPRWDLLGFIPQALDIYVSEKQTTAFQTYTGLHAYTYHSADNLAEPTKFTKAALPPLTWFDYKHASSNSDFTYNSGDINLDITSIHIHIGWLKYLWGAYSGEYRSAGYVQPPFDCYADLIARRTDAAGTDINDIVKLKPSAYAGDLDFIADFYRAADHRIDYTFDKMYIPRESFREITPEETEWHEKVAFRVEFLDDTSSLVVDEQNELNNDYYENP
jgi:hypothetical protein